MLDSSLLKAFPDDLFTELDQKVFDTSLNTPDKLYNALPQKLRNVRVVSDKREQVFQLFKQKQKDIKGKSKKEKKQQIYQTPITDSNVKSEVKIETILDFPFRSKLAAYLAKNDGVELEKKPEFVSDVSLSKSVNKYKKPNYSPFRNSWEIDIMFAGEKLYLVFLNINTRYAIIEPIKNKTAEEIANAITNIRNRGFKIEHVKGDGEKGFKSEDVFLLFKYDEHTHWDSSKFTFHNKQVDSFIRTLRNAAGLNEAVLANNDMVQQLVHFYNNTPHNGLPKDIDGVHYTPAEAQNNPNIEWKYIRAMDRKLRDVQKLLAQNGYAGYKPGNILLMHVDKNKTDLRMAKKRRNFDELGEFICYINGGVQVKWITKPVNSTMDVITVPIFYTKKIAESAKTLPDKYRKFFNYYKGT